MDKEFEVGYLVRVWKPDDSKDWVDDMDIHDGKVYKINSLGVYGPWCDLIGVDGEYTNVAIVWLFNRNWLTKVNCHLDIEWVEK